jgi:peptidoglycan LD-endopeptidase CwlK
MINSRNLDDLRPEAKALAEKFKRQCAAEGIDILFTSTKRDNECQAMLYAQGRSTPGNRVTNAKPGESFHNYGVAFDFVPLVGGKPQWEDLKLLNRCGVIAEACGLEWAGRWQSFRELLHCQMPGLTIAQLKAEAAAG